MKGRNIPAGFVILILLAFIITIGINILFSGLTERYSLRLDMTASGLYQISGETKELMRGVDRQVNIYCVSKSRDAVKEFSEMLSKYEKSSDFIKVEYIDPYTNSAYLDSLSREGIEVGLNTIIVESGENRRVLRMADMYVFSRDTSELVYFNAEAMLTSAIISVSSDRKETIGILMGHGEQIPSALQKLMVQNGFDLAGVVLNQDVDASIGTIIALAPQSDFSIDELVKLDAFFARGGYMMLFSDPSVPDLPNFDSFLEEWGIKFGDDVIFDAGYNIEANPINIIGYYVEHDITGYFLARQYYTVVPTARSIESDFQNTNGRKLEAVMATSDEAYARDIHTTERTTQRLAGDEPGPFMIAVTSTMQVNSGGETKTSGIFVMGSKRVVSDDMLNLPSAGNAKFFTKALEWCNEQTGVIVAIPPKQVGGEKITVVTETAYTFGVIFVVIVPAAILLLGLRVFLKRRYL